MFVLVYGERVEVPEGWMPIVGPIEDGDQCLMGTTTHYWADCSDQAGGDAQEWFDIVIRRDPGAEG